MAPLVPVLTAATVFEARLVAARLGADGIWCQLRGNVDGPYPMGPVEVLVAGDDLEVVQGLLLADAVEAVFDDDAGDADVDRPVPTHHGWLAPVAIAVALVGWTVARVVLIA